jgi:hypothetical protein
VEDRVESIGQDAADRGPVEQVGNDELGPCRDGFAVASLEVVEDDNVMSRCQELAPDDGTYVPCSPSDEKFHRRRGLRTMFGFINAGDITDIESLGR